MTGAGIGFKHSGSDFDHATFLKIKFYWFFNAVSICSRIEFSEIGTDHGMTSFSNTIEFNTLFVYGMSRRIMNCTYDEIVGIIPRVWNNGIGRYIKFHIS